MYKLFVFAAFIAVTRAGNLLAPAIAYSAAPVAVGSQHQSVVRTLDGNSAVSHYSKAVDTAFSSVRKYDTRVTNDAKLFAPAAIAYAAPAVHYAAPAVHYAAPAAPLIKAAPALSYAAPAYSYAAAAPIVKAAPALTYAAPAYSYAATPIVKAAPALTYAAPAYNYAAATPIVKAAPAYGYHTYAPSASYVAHASFSGLGANYPW